MKEKNTECGISILLALIGIGVIIFGIFDIMSISKFKETAVQTTATVVRVSSHTDSEGDTSYTVYLTYNVDGKKYNDSYTTSAYVKENSIQTIYYDKNNPAKMKTTISIGRGIMLIAFGIAFCASSFFIMMTYNKLNKAGIKRKLLEHGEKIYAEYNAVVINYSYSVNNRHPYNIICTWRDNNTGKVRTFKSENLWDNPEDIIKEKNITIFPVYVDTKNKKRYYLSVEELKRSKKI